MQTDCSLRDTRGSTGVLKKCHVIRTNFNIWALLWTVAFENILQPDVTFL